MSNDQDILIKQRIDALIEVYDEVNGDELKMAIRRLTRHVSSARERIQDVGNEDVTALTLLQWIYTSGGVQESP